MPLGPASAPVDGPVRVLTDPGGPIVIGHRGAAAQAPENTMESIQLALEAEAAAVEIDVWVSGDGVPVVIHDPSTGRVAERDIPVEESDLSTIQSVDAGFRFTVDAGRTFPYRGCGLAVPTLDAVLARFPSTAILLELKSPLRQDTVRRTLDRHAAHSRVVVASANHHALAAFRDRVYRVAASRREIGWWYLASRLGLAPLRAGYQVLSIPPTKGPLNLTDRRAFSAAARQGIPVHVWTVDDAATARVLWQAGATGIITNAPDRLRAVRQALVA